MAKSRLVYKAGDSKGLTFDPEVRAQLREAEERDQWGRLEDVVGRFRRDVQRNMREERNTFDELDEYDFHDKAVKRFLQKKKERLEKEALRQHYTTKRSHHLWVRTLFRKPVRFKLSEKIVVRILSTGILNPYTDRPKVPPRAFVGVFINEKRVFFYRSSGENSKQPGRWFPCAGVEIVGGYDGFPKLAGYVYKIQGHPYPGRPHGFPKWVDLVSTAIEKAVEKGRINLLSDTMVDDFVRFQEVLNFYPHLEKEAGYGEMKVLPDLDS